VASAIDEYVKNLTPIPSPFLVHNRTSSSAERGRKIFLSEKAGCAQCHRPPLFTDLKPHLGDAGKFDQATDRFYTPTLIELWRTAPYLHDGSAATLRDVLAVHGRSKVPGNTSSLTPAEVDDLVSFLLTL
jgi:cytochrome c peroxidase